MKSYFKDYFKNDFDGKLHLIIVIFWLVCLTANYNIGSVNGNFEDDILDLQFRGKPIYFLLFFLFYAFAYFGTVLICIFYKKDKIWWQNRTFWGVSLAGIAILAFDIGFYWESTIPQLLLPQNLWNYGSRAFDRMISLFTNILPLYILWRWTKISDAHFYGLTLKNSRLKPYFLMIAAMLPLLAWASFQPDFLQQYPTYRGFGAAQILGVPEWLTVLFYEIAYGIDFISIELFFRGFLVIGVGALIGKKAILPMAVLYSFIHFGKPMGEAFSSFFGGYILGVVSFYTRHIFGGLIVHLGIAWLMELFAFLQKYFSN